MPLFVSEQLKSYAEKHRPSPVDKLDGTGQDAVEEILGSDFLHLRRSQHLGPALKHGDSSFCAEAPGIRRRTAEGS